MSEIETLIKKRGIVKGKLTNFSKFVTKSKLDDKGSLDQTWVFELEQRYDRALNLISDFEIIQENIDLVSADGEVQALERENFETAFYASTAEAKRILTNSKNSRNSSLTVSPAPEQCVKLPSLIHNNHAVNDVQKFHYLLSTLTGEARQVIASLEITNTNYDVAWDLVCSRYNNPRILVQNHIKALFKIERITSVNSNVIRTLIDNIRKHLRALNTLKEPTDKWDTLIVYLVSTKLDFESNREWEHQKIQIDKPTLDDLLDCLKGRADLLESLEDKGPSKSLVKHQSATKARSFVVSRQIDAIKCVLCKAEHNLQHCPEFLQLNIQKRIEQVKKLKLCTNCLRLGHFINQCRSGLCKQCKSKHHTLLHITYNRSDSQQSPTTQLQTLTSSSLTTVQTLLSTVTLHAFDRRNKKHTFRALLDPGSQSSFITTDLRERLHLPETKTNISVTGITQSKSTISSSCLLKIHSHCTNFSLQVTCLVLPVITSNLPQFAIDVNSLKIPAHLRLADPEFYNPNSIDMLLGADYFWELLCIGQIKLDDGPVIQNTRFGWIVSGPVQTSAVPSVRCNLVQSAQSSKLHEQLTRFWEVESVNVPISLSKSDAFCEKHFQETTSRTDDGRFIVTIPIDGELHQLGESYHNAKTRLLSMERKFKRLPEFGNKYREFMREYSELGHMRRVVSPQESDKNNYYIPHHGVINEKSATTKLRVVFDASCNTSTGYSFNNLQVVGPTIQPDLFSALVRYRQYSIVVVSDIQKMYRACLVNTEQLRFQRILWRDSENLPIEVYELTTITYGTASASYLATRCLKQLGLESSDPVIANVIKNHFYVDDLLTGADSVQKVMYIIDGVSLTLNAGGFKLHKWVSNNPAILRCVSDSRAEDIIDMGRRENTRTLGLMWDPQKDVFKFNISKNTTMTRVTKRSILSEIAQIFDPLGLLSPVIIRAKIILQHIWQEGLDWDVSLPNQIYTRWCEFRDMLVLLNSIEIPRHISLKNANEFELHGFSDASIKAYGACVYLRATNSYNDCSVQLVCAKSRVAPIKPTTVPRLELLGALLLTDLVNKVRAALNLEIKRVVYWTDSSVLIGWLGTDPSKLHTFVGNRIARILDLSRASDWRYVSTEHNPADPVSRGIDSGALADLTIYWCGPVWLKQDESLWPRRTFRSESLPEIKVNVLKATIIEECVIPFTRFSTLFRLQRVIAYCLRFINNCSNKSDKRTGSLKCSELNEAQIYLIKCSQRDSFQDEINHLSGKGSLPQKNELTKLNVFLDHTGIMRVGGRLRNSSYNVDKKHPMLLHSKHVLTRLIFEHEHVQLLHAGPQHLLASIRDRYWPIGGRNLAKKVIFNCMRCFRVKPRVSQPIMGDLPSQRVTPAPPFSTTGVDYAGPFLLKDRKGRGSKTSKCYICLFHCGVLLVAVESRLRFFRITVPISSARIASFTS
ncbi:uncharacterized protein [Onthophagus taurus]|uniref:uncharacterized protein n=1 Tax=Onthophagus taurus TaxID=166361 RepID=UPI0039BDEDE8